MNRRERWRRVLDNEVARWSDKPYDDLRADLKDDIHYQVEFESVTHQVEVELLEDTPPYVHVSVAVDDGSLPWAMFPVSYSFICRPR